MGFSPRKTDTLYLHKNKNLWIEFEDFDEVMWQTKRWLFDWKRNTTEPAHYESLEDFLVAQEAYLRHAYGDAAFDLAFDYSFLSLIFQEAIESAATNPKRLHRQFMAMKSVS